MWHLETSHLLIRELQATDFDNLFTIYQEKNIRKFIPHIQSNREIEFAKLQAYIAMIYGFFGFGLWGVFLKEGERLIGQAGIESQLIDGKGEIMLSYLLSEKYQGKGYASEACRKILAYAMDELDFKRIVAVISPDNHRSINLAKNLGMTYEKDISHEQKDCLLYVIHSR